MWYLDKCGPHLSRNVISHPIINFYCIRDIFFFLEIIFTKIAPNVLCQISFFSYEYVTKSFAECLFNFFKNRRSLFIINMYI